MKKIILRGLVLLLLLGIGVMVFGVILPVYMGSREVTMSGPLTMVQQSGGEWLLSWPEAEEADRYRVELAASDGEVIFRDFAEGETSMLLPNLSQTGELTLRVTPAVAFRTILGEDHHYSEEALTASAIFGDLPAAVQDFFVNGDEKTLSMQMQCQEGVRWQYELTGEDGSLLAEQTLSEPSLVISFGDAIPLPEAGESYHLRARLFREEPGLLIYGMDSNDFRITEESLQYRKLKPQLTEVSKNTVHLTWEETRGAQYEVQVLDAETGSWQTVYTASQQQPRSWTDWVEPGLTRQYRVIAVDEQGQILVESEQMTAQGRDLTQYATVWPVQELAAYDSPDRNRVIATAKTGTAYCVLEETNGLFAVRIGEEIGYINSNYCMINLPEYMGGLCNYNITNSVYSIYAIHEFPIENVTGVITLGYEDICQEDGSYLVPLLYPAARRLRNAAQNAWDQGYRLKIYDSFRPHKATLDIYGRTSLIMDSPVPEQTYTGIPREEMELPSPRTGWDYLSLGWLMTGPNYAQNSFLAKGGSAHNLGIALDLTLENRQTGEELQMQSSMHDLSQYSVLRENNEAAELLGSIMHGAGFAGLISEWWHFQDDNAKQSLDLPYVSEGVSAECWVKDDLGWKYRDAKGVFYREQTMEIAGEAYAFDANGYVME